MKKKRFHDFQILAMSRMTDPVAEINYSPIPNQFTSD